MDIHYFRKGIISVFKASLHMHIPKEMLQYNVIYCDAVCKNKVQHTTNCMKYVILQACAVCVS